LSSNVVRFPWRPRHLDHEESRSVAERALEVAASERMARASELHLEDPEVLLCITEMLRSRLETTPASVLEDSVFLYNFLDKPLRSIGIHDEREYYLGEFALIAGTANRFLFRIDEAKVWLQRSEANFALTQNANAHWARLAYQRLALAVEERRFDEVLTLAPLWTRTFFRLEMPEDAIKCQFLEGAIRWELGEIDRATEINEKICVDAQLLGNDRLVAQATVNLVRFKGATGAIEQALRHAQKALSLLTKLNNRVHLVKLQWSIGDLLRKQGRSAPALEAYRHAQTEASELGMRGDLAALHLLVADLLLEGEQDAQAEWEIRAALPIIDEERMVPEGFAALSLLRDSLRHRQIDRQALRDLHGYFQEK
jgi:tetratricopeptide (TPR) repeat protein